MLYTGNKDQMLVNIPSSLVPLQAGIYQAGLLLSFSCKIKKEKFRKRVKNAARGFSVNK
jgi:hypothetical protein